MRFIWAIIAGILIAAIVVLVRDRDAPVVAPTSEAATARPPATESIRKIATQAAEASDESSESTPTTSAAADLAGGSDEPAEIEAGTDAIASLAPITGVTHVMIEGDTLQSIALRRYGDARLWRRIVDANPALAAGELRLGDSIDLPPLESIPDAATTESLVADLDSGRAERPKKVAVEDRIEVSDDAPRLDLGMDKEILDAKVVPGELVRLADDRIVADGEFTIRGEGTRESPYRVSWELLASAADGYRPSLGERDIPQRIAALDGAWIRIDGYVAFPLGGAESTEILAMLNQWDGCCIGIPPTPYDAIEVALSAPVPRSQRHAVTFGSLTGRLQVSPYLVENWLVGLYLMDDAELRIEL
ncbi:MAG: LysM peptidoglycan-binding domain-containing protein [Planctomycetota bacterium]|jgi:phage tail protein X